MQKIHSLNKCLITIGRKYEKVVETNSYFLHSFLRCPVKTMKIFESSYINVYITTESRPKKSHFENRTSVE